jgi:predicted O-methyltransferase YrrM
MDESRFYRALREGRPYFGPFMAAQQGEPSRKGYMRPLVSLVARQLPDSPINILEVGSWAGASTVAWAKALEAEGRAGKIVCVDHWNKYLDTTVNTAPVYHQMTAAVDNDAIYRLFRHNIRTSGVRELIIEMRGNSREILPRLAPQSFQVVYIDGSHAYDDVLSDIHHAMRLVCVNGIVCGDDLELNFDDCDASFLERACDERLDYGRDPRTGGFYHPGVTRAIAEVFSGDVTVQQGLWSVQNTGSTWRRLAETPSPVIVPGHLSEAAEEDAHEPPRQLARIIDPTIVVSIIVNYYQRESTLFAVIESLLEQKLHSCTMDQIEVIIVDDGTDGGSVRDRLPAKVTYLWQRKDQYGISRAKNMGARLANGKHLVFLDADVRVGDGYIDAVMHAFDDWDHRVVHCGYIWDYHHKDADDPRTEFGVWENPGSLTRRFYQVAGGNLAIAKSLFLETGGFDEDLIYGGVEDLLFGYQLSRLPHTAVRFDPRMVSWHLPHAPSLAHANVPASWNVVKAKHPEFYDQYIVKGLR